jgi:hypothetical protein
MNPANRYRKTWRNGDGDLRSDDGKVTHNPIQQHEPHFDPPRVDSPIEEGDTGTTDPWGITP